MNFFKKWQDKNKNKHLSVGIKFGKTENLYLLIKSIQPKELSFESHLESLNRLLKAFEKEHNETET